jgi:hypothetical protein
MQVKGFGTRLMNHTKVCACADKSIADTDWQLLQGTKQQSNLSLGHCRSTLSPVMG